MMHHYDSITGKIIYISEEELIMKLIWKGKYENDGTSHQFDS